MPGPHVDVVASAESLPLESETFDCVLCTQVLQYLAAPERAVAEMRRVLKPDGLLMLSTHGVSFVDRRGCDQWRWTHHGLRSLLDQAGRWSLVEVLPAGGVLSAAAYLVGGQTEFATHHLGVPWLAAPICLVANLAGWHLDQAAKRRFPNLPPDAAVNYLVVARRQSD